MTYYLIADVGGTNIRLAIAREQQQDYFLLQSYKCNKFSTINEAIKYYLKTIPKEFQPKSGAMAIAATILSDNINMTNNNWSFSIKALQLDLGFNKLAIINDFEAQAYALEYLKPQDYVVMQEQKNISSNINKRVITGPGTGLGTCFLYKPHDEWLIIPSEAGHSTMASVDDMEDLLHREYFKIYNRMSYAEEFLSGRGLVNIYKILAKQYNYEIIEDILPKTIVEKALDSNIKAKRNNKILDNNVLATKFNDNIYLASLDVFCNLFGSYVSNIALMYLPQQIYLTGGILPKIINYFQDSGFKARFLSNQILNVQNLLHNTAIYLITKENPAMLGITRYVINNK